MASVASKRSLPSVRPSSVSRYSLSGLTGWKSQMDSQVRRYQPADEDSIVAIWRAASQSAHPFLSAAFLTQEERKIREVYLPNAETWVFVQGAAVVGFIALLGDEVGAVFVHPELQRSGIGRALMDMVVGVRGTVFLDVFKANRIGRSFYDRYGFTLEREHVHHETGQPLLRLCYRGLVEW